MPAPIEAIVDRDNAHAWAAAADSVDEQRGLILAGAVGAGKTTALAEIARACWKRDVAAGLWKPATSDRPYQTWLDEPFIFTTAADFCDDVKATYGWKFNGPPQLEDCYTASGLGARCRRLFLDDLGVEASTAANCQMIVQLLHDRDARKLPTWISTNLTRAEFAERYGSRAWDRLRATNKLIGLLGGSRRIAV